MEVGDTVYGYVYLTQNNVNGRMYVGQHKSGEYDPSYLGSGKVLKMAISKYGSENFSQIILDVCESKEELDEKEIYWIGIYKEKYQDLLYNIAGGGEGGRTFLYKTDEERQEFRDKMTEINRARCYTDEFRHKISAATSKRFEKQSERDRQSEIVRNAWANPTLRQEQSDRLKRWYKNNSHDTTYLKIKCRFELNGEKIDFDSINELKSFLKQKYGYSIGNNQLKKLFSQGKNRIPFSPFHKNKLKDLAGMIIYTIDDDVETNCDECNSVETETSAVPKDGALT